MKRVNSALYRLLNDREIIHIERDLRDKFTKFRLNKIKKRNFTLRKKETTWKNSFCSTLTRLFTEPYYAFINRPLINSKGENTSAVRGFVNTLNEVLNKENPTHLGVAFDHGKTFRDEGFSCL